MDTRSSPLGGGDLGRRVTEQRERAGLARKQAARLAGMSVSYLAYLETSPAPRPCLAGQLRAPCWAGAVHSSCLVIALPPVAAAD